MLLIFFSIILLWNIIITALGKADRSRVFCGMVGYCGENPADPMIMRILLMYNNSRGGDATGWVVNDEITKDTVKVEEFLEKNNLVTSPEHSNYTIIAHARRSSNHFTRSSKAHAHPFGIYKDGTEKSRYDLVLAMNGTMNNEEAFAEEFGYDWNKNTKTDTQMLATVMAQLGTKDFVKALQGYDGAATLLFYTPRAKNTLCVYKDSARTLYSWQRGPREVYISSMKESLKGAGASEADIYDFKGETLYRYEKGELKNEIKINRSPLTKAVSYSQNWSHSGDRGRTTASYSSSSPGSKPDNSSTLFDMDVAKMDKGGNCLCFSYDKYYRNHHPISGEFYVNDQGEILHTVSDSRFTPNHQKRYFIAGYMIKDEESFKKLKDRTYDGANISWTKFQDIKTSELIKYVDYPIQAVSKTDTFWILPASLQDKLKDQNAQVTVSPFLSQYDVNFKLDKGNIKGTNIKCAKIASYKISGAPVKIKPKSDSPVKLTDEQYVSMLFDTFGEKQIEDYIAEKLIANPDEKPTSLYNKARYAVFMMNGCQQLANFFYADVLLDMALNHDLISANDVMAIASKAETSGDKWNATPVQKELERITKLLAEKLKMEKENPAVVDAETDVNKGGFIDEKDLPAKERLQLAKMNQSGLSVKDTIAEIEKGNRILSNNDFRGRVVNAEEEWSVLTKRYAGNVGKFSNEMAEFAQAVASVLCELTAISDSQLADMYCMSNEDLVEEVSMVYTSYCEGNKGFVIDEEEISMKDFNEGYETLDDQDDDDDSEDIDDEKFSPEEAEEEIESCFQGVLESLKLIVDDCNVYKGEFKTERIQLIEKRTKECLEFLNKHVGDGLSDSLEINN